MVQPDVCPGYGLDIMSSVGTRGSTWALAGEGNGAMRHYSFSISRPGLKPGYTIPSRFRLVDALTLLSAFPQIAVMGLIIVEYLKAAWDGRLGPIFQNAYVYLACMLAVVCTTIWTVSRIFTVILRFLFRVLGLLSQEESRLYPLEISKHYVAPWPESWQQAETEITTGNDSSLPQVNKQVTGGGRRQNP